MKRRINFLWSIILTIFIIIYATGCGQSTDNGSERELLTEEQEEASEEQEEAFIKTEENEMSGFIYQSGSLNNSVENGKVLSGIIKTGDKAILVKSDGTIYETVVEQIALYDKENPIPVEKAEEGLRIAVWLEGINAYQIQSGDLLIGITEWERGLPMGFPFEESEEYTLTLAPEENTDKQGELRLYNKAGEVLQRIPYGIFTEPDYYVLRKDDRRNLVIFPDKESDEGRFFTWDGGQFSEQKTDVKKGVTGYWSDLLITKEGESELIREVYRQHRTGNEAEEIRRFYLQKDTGELEIWDCLDNLSLFHETVLLNEDKVPVNEEYYDLLFFKDLYEWAWEEEEKNTSFPVEIYGSKEENTCRKEEYESREAFLEAYGFHESVPVYLYYNRLHNLRLELYKEETEDLFCVVLYGYAYDSKRQKCTSTSGLVICGSTKEEWTDDTWSVMSSIASYQIEDYKESIEYTPEGKPRHFLAEGLDKITSDNGDIIDMLKISYVYRDDGSLYFRDYWRDAIQFETYRCTEKSFYDEKERLIYQRAYITHGWLEDYYIYLDEGDIPAYRLELDYGGSGTYIERYR